MEEKRKNINITAPELERMVQYRETVGAPHAPNPCPTFEVVSHYSKLLVEELDTELLDTSRWSGSVTDNLTHIADCLADGQFLLHYLVCALGMQDIYQEICDEVMRSNRTKGRDGKFFDADCFVNGENLGRLVKGENYERPNLRQFFGGPIDLQLKVISLDEDDVPDFVQFVSRELMHEPSVGHFTWKKTHDNGGGEFSIEGGAPDMFIRLKRNLLGDWMMRRRISAKNVSDRGTVLVTVNDQNYHEPRLYSA